MMHGNGTNNAMHYMFLKENFNELKFQYIYIYRGCIFLTSRIPGGKVAEASHFISLLSPHTNYTSVHLTHYNYTCSRHALTLLYIRTCRPRESIRYWHGCDAQSGFWPYITGCRHASCTIWTGSNDRTILCVTGYRCGPRAQLQVLPPGFGKS